MESLMFRHNIYANENVINEQGRKHSNFNNLIQQFIYLTSVPVRHTYNVIVILQSYF